MADTAFSTGCGSSVEPLVLLRYEKSEAQTDYVEFAGRPHLMMSAEGWEEIAAAIEEWLEQGARRASVPRSSRADPARAWPFCVSGQASTTSFRRVRGAGRHDRRSFGVNAELLRSGRSTPTRSVVPIPAICACATGQARNGIETSRRRTYPCQYAMPPSSQRRGPRSVIRRGPDRLNSIRPSPNWPPQAGSRAWRMPAWRRRRSEPRLRSTSPQAAPKPIAASLQLKPPSATTVTILGRTLVSTGRCDRCWSTDEQYWWHVPRGMCTVDCSLAREGVPGPQRPAVAAAGVRLASAITIARPLMMRCAWRCMRSPFAVVSAALALPSTRCSSPVAHRLRAVDRRLRAAAGLA
jgi:hypothetical protein